MRDDLRDAVLAVLALNVSDNAVTLLLTEIDVEIRHRNTFGVQKAFEEKPEAQRVEIGNRQRVCDERAGTRSASRPDGDAVRLRPLDEIGDDKEVAGKLHLRDDVDFVGEALVVILLREARGQSRRLKAMYQSLLGLALQLGSFEAEIFDFAQAVVALHEARQNRLLPQRTKRASDRDFDRVCQRLRKICKERRHFGFAFEIMFWAGPAAIVLDDITPIGNAQQHIVRFVVSPHRKIALVCRDDRQAPAVGELQKLGFDVGFFCEPVSLQLDVKTIAKNLLERLQPLNCLVALPASERCIDRSLRTTRQRYEPTRGFLEPRDFDMRRFVERRLKIKNLRKPHQIGEAFGIHREQRDFSGGLDARLIA